VLSVTEVEQRCRHFGNNIKRTLKFASHRMLVVPTTTSPSFRNDFALGTFHLAPWLASQNDVVESAREKTLHAVAVFLSPCLSPVQSKYFSVSSS
jgi:hypothetical protein